MIRRYTSIAPHSINNRNELKAGGNTIRGTAIVYDVWQRIGDIYGNYWMERIARGAPKLRDDLFGLYGHDRHMVLARAPNTLRTYDTRSGLQFEMDLDPSNPFAAMVLSSVRRRDIRGMSFGFWITRDDWEMRDDMPHCTVEDCDVEEITVTGFPAYKATEVDIARAAPPRNVSQPRASSPVS